MKGFHIITALALACLASIAQAQTAGTVNLSATPGSGNGGVTPVVTWSTSPTASSCTASGGWSGSKGASGTQTLPAMTSTTDLTLTCSWPGALGSAKVSWTPPTTNTDGTSLVDLVRFRVLYGTSATSLNQSLNVPTVTATSADVTGLSPGTWYFAVRAINESSVESANSNVASKTIAGGTPPTASKTVTVTVNKVPSPPTNTTVIETTAYNIKIDEQRMLVVRGTAIGRAPMGAACEEHRVTADGYSALSRPSRVQLYPSVSVRPTTIVAKCG